MKVINGRLMRKNRQKNREEQKHQPNGRWVFFSVCILFITGVAYIFILSPLVDIENISVINTNRTDKSVITAHAGELLSGKKYSYIHNANYFFLDEEKIKKYLLSDQRIKDISIKKKFPHSIEISVTEYSLMSVWCVGDAMDNCYLLEDGCVTRTVNLDDALIQANSYYIISDKGHDQLSMNQCVMSQEDLDRIVFLGQEFMYALNVGINKPYVIEARGSREVRFVTDESWQIVASVKQSPQETIEMARLFITKTQFPTSRADLEYIDLRFAEKIFYKLKDGVEVEEKVPDENTEENQKVKKDEKIENTHD